MNTQLKRKPPANVVIHNVVPDERNDLDEVMAGLTRPQKTINPRFFYDTRGSQLFEKITTTPEYYPTRVERKLLSRLAPEIAACCGPDCVLIEPGSGSCEKVQLLLGAIRPGVYVPIDIAADFLAGTAYRLGEAYPELGIRALCADFSAVDLAALDLPDERRVVFYPGSTIGNMTPGKAAGFLAKLRDWVGTGGGVILGIDLHKDTRTLNAAYNDAAGLTAAFNLNCLTNINRLVDADFDTARFAHRAFYNESMRRIEMHLDCLEDHVVTISRHRIHFRRGESIHTENSYKYSDDQVARLAQRAGLALRHSWHDSGHQFGIYFLQAQARTD